MFTQTSIIQRGEMLNHSPKEYLIKDKNSNNRLVLPIQKNPMQKVGRNGFLLEELILIGIDQLESYQDAEHTRSIENEVALNHLREALYATRARQYERSIRGVQDTLKK